MIRRTVECMHAVGTDQDIGGRGGAVRDRRR
jgi:hypothetical protein